MAGYGTDEGLAAWMTSNGHAMPSGAPPPAVLRQRASDYIDGLYGARFTGAPADPLAQERAWPRVGATAYGKSVPDDMIPVAVINASYAAAFYEAENPGALSIAVTASGAVKREKVAALEVEYFGGSGDVAADATPVLSYVEGLLAPYLTPEAVTGGIGLWSIG